MLIKICDLSLNGNQLLVDSKEEWICLDKPENKKQLESKMMQLITLYNVIAGRVQVFYHNEPINDWLIQHMSQESGYKCVLERQFNGSIRAILTPQLNVQDFWKEFLAVRANS